MGLFAKEKREIDFALRRNGELADAKVVFGLGIAASGAEGAVTISTHQEENEMFTRRFGFVKNASQRAIGLNGCRRDGRFFA